MIFERFHFQFGLFQLLPLVKAMKTFTLALASTVTFATSNNNHRSVQVWVSTDNDSDFPGFLETLTSHKSDLSDVSALGLFTIDEDGLIVVNETRAERAGQIKDLELGIWPMLGGSIEDLRRAMLQPNMIDAAVATAAEHGWNGYNLDFELNVNTTDGCFSNDTALYKSWLDNWSLALQAAQPPMGLQVDVGGCNDPFMIDFCGMTCDDYVNSSLDRLVTMNTYDNNNLTNFEKSLALDVDALCGDEGCGDRYQAGILLDHDKNSDSDPGPVMDMIKSAGVSKISLWVNMPPDQWWPAFGEFLNGDN